MTIRTDAFTLLIERRGCGFFADLCPVFFDLQHWRTLFLSDLGRREDALDAAEEAVRLRRRLAGERPVEPLK